MFVFNILVYVFFVWVMYKLAKKSVKYSLLTGKINQIDRFLWGYILFFTLISAIRWGVGADSIQYALVFRDGPIYPDLYFDKGEYIWHYLVRFINLFHIHFTIGLAIASFAQIFFLVKGTLEYKYILIFLPIVLFGGQHYFVLMNGVRQMIVACSFVFASKWIVEKKLLNYLVFIWIMHYVHLSALLLIPLYFIPNKFTLSDHRSKCLILFIICFILGQNPHFQGMIEYVESFTKLIGYEKHSEFVKTALEDDYSDENKSFGPTMLSFFLCSLIPILLSNKLKVIFRPQIKYFDLWYNFSIFYSCFYFLVYNVSHIFIRPIEYFEFFLVIIICLCLYMLFYSNVITNHIYLGLAFVFIIWICNISTIYKSSNLPKGTIEYSIYKVFWMHENEIDLNYINTND